MNRVAITAAFAGALVLVAAGGGYVWAIRAGQADLQRATAQIRAAVGPSGAFSYASASIHPLSRSAELGTVMLRTRDGMLCTADDVVVAGSGTGRISSLHLHALHVSGGTLPGAISVDSLDGDGIDLSGAPSSIARAGTPATIDPADVAVDGLAAHGLAIAGPGTTLTVSEAHLGDYGPGRASSFDLHDASLPLVGSSAGTTLSVAHLSGDGVALADLLASVEHGQAAPDPGLRPSRFELEGLRVDKGAVRPLQIDEVLVVGTPGAGVERSTATVSGVTIAPADEAAHASLQNALGLDSIRADLSSASSYRPAGGALDIAPFVVSAASLGRARLVLRLQQLDAAAIRAAGRDPMAMIAAMMKARLGAASLDLVDGGMLHRLMSQRARAAGVAEDQLRTLLAASLRNGAAFAGFPDADRLRGAVADFVAQGGTLSLSATPATPIALSDVAAAWNGPDPDAQRALLNLTATRTP